MLVDGSGLLVSLPAEELRGMTPSASLFAPSELDRHPLSNELRWVLQAATQACMAKKVRMLVVARPEIFTHGESLRWLQDQLMGIKDHLCVSDGTAVRPIRGMRNHLFLYRQASHVHAAAFERLIGWVPELLDSIHSQVNSCISVRCGRRAIAPPTLLLQADIQITGESQLLVLRHHVDLKVSAKRTSEAPPKGLFPKLQKLIYAPLTESAYRNIDFMGKLAAAIRASQRATAAGVLMGLPDSTVGQLLESRVHAALAALRAAGINKAIKPGSVMFATGDLWPTRLAAPGRVVDLLAHTSYPFWRHPKEYYVGFRNLETRSAGTAREQRAWQELLNAIAGRTQ
jgi:hypothetical protein